jgi:hypothetical protein
MAFQRTGTIMNQKRDIYYGTSLLTTGPQRVSGDFVTLEGERFYRISNYDRMPPFFMSIVSPSDQWMYASSKGSLTCGRKDPDGALFPYYTDDKIHDGAGNTGARSLVIIDRKGKSCLWEPFSPGVPGVYEISRNLYKNRMGNILIFEEINQSLKLSFLCTWMNSDSYGFVKRSAISNLDVGSVVHARILDGLQNILPYGVTLALQSNMSTLLDGYKKCELIEEKGLGIYTLSSILTDKAEPSEALKATTVWSVGLKDPGYLLGDDQLQRFREGSVPDSEKTLKGRRGNYFVYSGTDLEPGETRDWLIVADTGQGPSDVAATVNLLEKRATLKERVLEDVSKGTEKLDQLVSMADGNQVSNDELVAARHFSNALFNIMRGGVFPSNYLVDRNDVKDFIGKWNAGVLKNNRAILEDLKDPVNYPELLEKGRETGDADLIRLLYEYLPLAFSRRHGDPSRPWNRFSIDLKRADGRPKLYFQGNWRDIFQNWEALALSYPEFIESFIVKFVNASTADGYNPYRVTRDGIDWEVPNPEDPWSNIGYWGDHQIIYLLKFIELSRRYHPGKLQEQLSERIFTYAHVPYRIKPYPDLVSDPHNSISYDPELEKSIAERVTGTGADGRLRFDPEGKVLKVNLAEKLLVPLLAKLGNFVPEGGIWMNTQRPEWNDANNALAGCGLSMVTLYYLRRFISTLSGLFRSVPATLEVSAEVAELFQAVYNILSQRTDLLKGRIHDFQRREITDLLGEAGSKYRSSLYEKGFSGQKRDIRNQEWLDFFETALEFIDHSIEANRRVDGLYHAYNLVEFGEKECRIGHLYEMLEGQVAAISSGHLDAGECLSVLNALRASKMYRQDQGSYTLYPDKELPGFLEKNILPAEKLGESPFLSGEVANGRRSIVEKDENGICHFNGSFRNASELREKLKSRKDIPAEEIDKVCDLFTECFDHKQFTGRSGSFYKYEGLGCIYWHMVSKLLLAVQEICLKADEERSDPETIAGLREHYEQIKEGLGLKKPPDAYGAFPTDPYSHTPGFAGVQQPGMTGQVKEDFITRFGELGVIIEGGCIRFHPRLLSDNEFLDVGRDWTINDRNIKLKKGELGFTLCGTPVIYRRGKEPSIHIELADGREIRQPGTDLLDRDHSRLVFERSGSIRCIRVTI